MKKTIIYILLFMMAAMPAMAQKTLPQGMTQEQYDAIQAKLPKGVTVEMVIANLPEGMTLEQALKIMAQQQAEKAKQEAAAAAAQQAGLAPQQVKGGEVVEQNNGLGTPEIIPFFALNLGMTSSLGCPRETRAIEASNYNFNFAVGAIVSQRFAKKWGVETGFKIERKGSNSNVIMKDYFTKVHLGAGETQGYFSGRSQGWHDVYALTFPLDIMYQPNQKWSLHVGPYFSYQFSRDRHGVSSEGYIRESPLSPLISVDHSESDNSDKVSKWDCGINVGCTRQMWRRIYLVFDFSWGFINQWDGTEYGMKKNIYNIYAQLGFGYKFYTSKKKK